MMVKRKKQKKEEIKKENIVIDKEMYSNKENARKSLKEIIAPDSVNPNPLDYMILWDGAEKAYVLTMYIEKMPKDVVFASTFTKLFNQPGVTSKVLIDPVRPGKAGKMLDNRIVALDSELAAAERNKDRNRIRKIGSKMRDTEGWASDIEDGENRFFKVTFLYTIMDKDIDKLRIKARDLHSKALEKGILLCACHSVHPEAFLATAPCVEIPKLKKGLVQTTTAKSHNMDIYSLACIFNHTRSDFSHNMGVVIGHHMGSGQAFVMDPFAPSNNGYGVIVCGKTGTGKSAMVKMFNTRNLDYEGHRKVSIDVESKGSRGEYALTAEQSGGVSYQFSSRHPENRLNIFEVDEELIYDEVTGVEYRELRLKDSMNNQRHILMLMLLENRKDKEELSDVATYRRIIGDIIQKMFAQRGIVDGDPDSLYTYGTVYQNGHMSSGKVKKALPTMHEFFINLVKENLQNKNKYHSRAYNTMIDVFRDFVEEIYYSTQSGTEFSKEEYETMESDNGKHFYVNEGKKEEVVEVHGLRAYYDGRSTIIADTSMPWINLDISQLPEDDKPLAQIVCMNYINENHIKKNSMNPKKIGRLTWINDEFHKTFPYEDARLLAAEVYRTSRKRFVSAWTITQGYVDYDGYKEVEAIRSQAAITILFKQDENDREYLNNTVLTPAQVEEVLSLGGEPDDKGEFEDARKGEMCVIINNKVSFVKVDYLTASEAYVVETDMSKIKKMVSGGR